MMDNDLPRRKDVRENHPTIYLSGRKMREGRGLSEAIGFWKKLITNESRWCGARDAEAKTLR
jgi:hypothetical protein